MGKKERHAAIMELIQQKELETQEDLIQALLEQGISVTQATISRDIRELQLVNSIWKTVFVVTVCRNRHPFLTIFYGMPFCEPIMRGKLPFYTVVLAPHRQSVRLSMPSKTIALWERLPEMIPFLFCCGQKNRLPFSQNNMQFGCKRKKGKRYAERTLY